MPKKFFYILAYYPEDSDVLAFARTCVEAEDEDAAHAIGIRMMDNCLHKIRFCNDYVFSADDTETSIVPYI